MPPAYLKTPTVVKPPTVAPPQCSGKVRFEHPALACEAAARGRDKHRTHYKCYFCRGWHVGTSEGYLPAVDPNLIRRELI